MKAIKLLISENQRNRKFFCDDIKLDMLFYNFILGQKLGSNYSGIQTMMVQLTANMKLKTNNLS